MTYFLVQWPKYHNTIGISPVIMTYFLTLTYLPEHNRYRQRSQGAARWCQRPGPSRGYGRSLWWRLRGTWEVSEASAHSSMVNCLHLAGHATVTNKERKRYVKNGFTIRNRRGVYGAIQGLSQDLETGCLKLAIVKFLGVQTVKGDHNLLIFQP